MSDTTIALVRLPEALRICGSRRAFFYRQMGEGLMPKGVRIGVRATAWPVHELEAVCRARLRGASKEEVKMLISKLMEERKAA